MNRLTIIELNGKFTKVKCICGTIKNVLTSNLKSGKTKSCGCLRTEISTERIKKYPAKKLDSGVGSANYLLNRYKQTCKNKDIKFNLTKEEFYELTSSDCYYCGCNPSQTIKGKRSNGEYNYNGIDRLDSNLDYNIENCVSCCSTCNYMKRDLTVSEFEKHITKIYNFISKNEEIKQDRSLAW